MLKTLNVIASTDWFKQIFTSLVVEKKKIIKVHTYLHHIHCCDYNWDRNLSLEKATNKW